MLDMFLLHTRAGHSTIIDAYMSLAILYDDDDRARYDKAVGLFHDTGGNFTVGCNRLHCLSLAPEWGLPLLVEWSM
jgi:hypothetical protein